MGDVLALNPRRAAVRAYLNAEQAIGRAQRAPLTDTEEAVIRARIRTQGLRSPFELRPSLGALEPSGFPRGYDVERDGAMLAALWEHLASLSDVRTVLDAGCGVGIDLPFLAERFPRIEFWGSDCDGVMLRLARERARRRALGNVIFVNARHRDLPRVVGETKFDAVVVKSALVHRDEADLVAQLRGCAAVLRERGRIIILERASLSIERCLVSASLGGLTPVRSSMATLALNGAAYGWMGAFCRRDAIEQ